MSFRPEALPGAEAHAPGEVDYRLARQSLVAEYRRGRLARHEVCDAHPELRRVAREFGAPTSQPCPICDEDHLLLVTYVFGPRLPAHGRVITKRDELSRLAARRGPYTCYLVEVCVTCWWNHLARSFELSPGRSGAARR